MTLRSLTSRLFRTPRLPSELDLTLIGRSASGGGDVVVDYGSSELPSPEAMCVQGLHGAYQELFYADAHYLFVCSAQAASKIAAVLRMPDSVRKAYYALVVDRGGITDHWIPQKAVVGEGNEGQASPRDLEERFLAYFRAAASSLTTAATAAAAAEERCPADSPPMVGAAAEDGEDSEWRAVSPSKTDLPCLLLGLECRLGLGKRIAVGVIYNGGGQSEEEAAGNEGGSAQFERFLDLLCSRVSPKVQRFLLLHFTHTHIAAAPPQDWRHWRGGLAADVVSIPYTSWRGFEIVFHVATELSSAGTRQHIANDKASPPRIGYVVC